MSDLVSIIITNYNYGHYLAEAIESALAQTYKPIEVIVIDDGSTDDSLDVAAKYNVVMLQQENQGVSAARNNAVKHAEGKYIIFLDADDLLFPYTIEKMMDAMSKAADQTGYIYGQFEYFGHKDGIFESQEFSAKALSRENYICITTLIKKSAFNHIKGFDNAFNSREDWELYVRLYRHGYHGKLIKTPILKYRKHKNTKHKRFNKAKNIIRTKMFLKHPAFFWHLFLKKFHLCIFYMLTTPECWDLGKYNTESPAKPLNR